MAAKKKRGARRRTQVADDGTATDSAASEHMHAAKRALLRRYSSEPWFRGAGIGADALGRPILRLNVAPRSDRVSLPQTFEGHKLEVVEIEGYEPRGPGEG